MHCLMRFTGQRSVATRRGVSDILCGVGKRRLFPILLVAAVLVLAFGLAVHAAAQQAPAPATAQQVPSAPATPAPPPTAPNPPPVPPVQVAPSGPVVVIDPAHGGTDSGAHGDTATEKEVVLGLARAVRAALERQGFRTVMTRNEDSNPSYDDRASTANAYRDAIFVSLHASSTGATGTVRAYYMQFATPIPAAPASPAAEGHGAAAKPPTPPALTSWTEAQRAYVPASHRLADLLQGEFARTFSGSPPYSAGVPVRALRSVTAPAVAVEVSSVAAPDQLAAVGDPLGNAIARAINAFRQGGGGGR